MAKQISYSFEEKKYSGNGIAATVLGLISVLLLAAMLLWAFVTKGNGSTWTGAVGFTGFAMGFCGLTFGFRSFRDECKYYFFNKFGTILCAASVAVWFFIVCIGLTR